MNELLIKLRNPFTWLILLPILLFLWFFWIFISPFFVRATAYKQYIQDTTTGYIILQPYKIQKYIRKLAPTATRWIKQIPRVTSLQPGPIRLDWFHNLTREFSLLFDYIPGTGFETHLIIREKRNSTAFIEELNSSRVLNEFCLINWRTPITSNVNKDIWINEGFIYGKKSFSNDNPLISNPIQLKNKHFLEILWINRDQNADIILESLVRCFPKLNHIHLPTWQVGLQNTAWIYLYLNLIQDNFVNGELIICPHSSADNLKIRESISTLNDWIQSQLPSPMQLEIQENPQGENLTWEIQFYDFEPHLKRALGNFSD